MSDSSNSSSSPFAAFSTASGFDMLEKMWSMMQVPGMGGTPSPSSMISGMMAPMTNIDELDKRITDMRAVEQWLKLNLNLLQSAIQALEVQRATLATLKAFGAFAQSSMEQAAAAAPEVSKVFVKPADVQASTGGADKDTESPAGADPLASIDATPWWNLLQAQFSQIAGLAMAAQQAPKAAANSEPRAAAKATPKASATGNAVKPTDTGKPAAKAVAKPVSKTASSKTGASPGKS